MPGCRGACASCLNALGLGVCRLCVCVHRPRMHPRRLLGKLHAGDHFGSLGDGVPHAGTVVATTHVECYSISRADLDMVLQQWPELGASLGPASLAGAAESPACTSSTAAGSQQPQPAEPQSLSAHAALDCSAGRCLSGGEPAEAADSADDLPVFAHSRVSSGLLERRSVPSGSSRAPQPAPPGAQRLGSASTGLNRSSLPLGVAAGGSNSSGACRELATLGDLAPMQLQRRASRQGSGLFRTSSGGGARYLFPAFENRPT